MARLHGEQRSKGQLGSPVAFPEGMDRIQVCEKRGGLFSTSLRLPSSEDICGAQPGEQRPHLTGDVLGKTERASILRHSHGSVASSPTVDILKEMPMYRAIVRRGKAADRKRLFRSHGNAEGFKRLEFCRIAQAELVLQDGRAGVAVPVRLGIVEVGTQTFFLN